MYLMCFYHVVAYVVKRTSGMTSPSTKQIFRDIYDVHFSASAAESGRIVHERVGQWSEDPQTKVFAEYFTKKWLSGNFFRWQCWYTAPGFATTNNPVEQFNRKLKRDYTLRARLKMGTLLQQLSECCTNESSLDHEFRDYISSSTTLQRRVKELVRLNLLAEFISSQKLWFSMERFG